ncbi:mechanosensitive ion channel family protein [Henriciella aquimarina]|uniref:mechanosensitive ion channel family protein n=1 Tax=Henriciella aquimarina TaxID=545261 RepID=UPI000A048B18|nr:mechanosensitive ion channel domain-containing protein [Henriciella aquimarina]
MVRKIPGKLAWIGRLRTPVLILLTALALWAGATYVWPLHELAGETIIAVRFLTICAVGWAITSFTDLDIKRRMAKLDIDVADNMQARKTATRLDVMRRVIVVVGAIATLACALVVVPWARQLGVSLLASAGIVGIAVGLAARPVLSNLIAGIQIAFTQPIRIEDAVVLENEWGWIEEIDLFYVVVRIWDRRRLIVPLTYFIEKPFQNWTRTSGTIIGSVYWWLDYRAPVAKMRDKLEEIVRSTDLWDGEVVNLQVSETDKMTIQVRALATASTSPRAWDLRCYIREQMINWLQAEHPEAFPRLRARAEVSDEPMSFSPPPKPSDIELGDQSLDGTENLPENHPEPKA